MNNRIFVTISVILTLAMVGGMALAQEPWGDGTGRMAPVSVNLAGNLALILGCRAETMPGERLPYQVDYWNSGDTPVSGVRLEVRLPSNCIFEGSVPEPDVTDLQVGLLEYRHQGDLGPSEHSRVQIYTRVSVDAMPGTNLRFHAEIAGDRVSSAVQGCETLVASPCMACALSVPPEIRSGAEISLTLTCTNTLAGGPDAIDWRATVMLPSGFEGRGGGWEPSDGQAIRRRLPSVPSGQSVTVPVPVRLKAFECSRPVTFTGVVESPVMVTAQERCGGARVEVSATSMIAPCVMLPIVLKNHPVVVTYCGTTDMLVYEIAESAFRPYPLGCESASPPYCSLITVTVPPAPARWNESGLVPDSSWKPAQAVWFNEWFDPKWRFPEWARDGALCGPIGLLGAFGTPKGVDGTTYLFRREIAIAQPLAGMTMTVTSARLYMWSDNRSAWYWNGIWVAGDREGYMGEVDLRELGLVSELGGNYVLAAQASNDYTYGLNPHGIAYLLRVNWEFR